MTFLDLFSGIGGFAQGLLDAGFEFDKHYYSEIDKNAQKCYQKHFPNAIALGDIRGIEPDKLGRIDIVTFGFPCQDISRMGQRAGLKGKRSSLFYEALRIISVCKPKVFIFENVEGLFTSSRGKDFASVLFEISQLGLYECQWELLNTAEFLPQNRERVYFVGFLGKGSFGQIFPLRQDFEKNTLVCGQKTQTITTPTRQTVGDYIVKGNIYEKTKRLGKSQRIKMPNKNADTLLGGSGGQGGYTGLWNVEGGVRMLTETECERLQGFPKNWTEGFSKTSRYQMLGNAVSVPVVKAIGIKIKRILDEQKS
jgi:DNA (cytosine-5)-methyltransferase 1